MIRSLTEINFSELLNHSFTPSPLAWEDQVLYFLLVDRFSNNTEEGFVAAAATPLYTTSDNGNAIANPVDGEKWVAAGGTWCGGNIKGLTNKIGYLKEMGVTTIWISPVFKQVTRENSYHGYGIQNYLEVDEHFGTKEDLRALVQRAHEQGIYVILDIIINHSGNVFSYDADRYLTTKDGRTFQDPRWDGKSYKVKGFNNAAGEPVIPFKKDIEAGLEDAIWPREFQNPDTFSAKGKIVNWDYLPEYLDGDFESLKDIHLGFGPIEQYLPSKALLHLCEVYKYWIAYLDIDGYRVDTIKHTDDGAARFFVSVIHEFTQLLRKENFYIIGEITGGRQFAVDKLDATGLDAALGIDDVQTKMESTVKGLSKPEEYFNLFKNSILVGKESHTWFKNKIVTMIDDHDKVVKAGHKSRFCAYDEGDKLILNALALNLTTLGIPCIYYGSEQGFDGQGAGPGADKYIREAMFGGDFGAFRSKGKHFFDNDNFIYKELCKITAVRKQKIALRRGRQFLREISGNNSHFGLPSFLGQNKVIRSVIAWSRILDKEEIVLAINTDIHSLLSAWVTIDNNLHSVGEVFRIIYSTDNNFIGRTSTVGSGNGRSFLVEVPQAGFVIYEKVLD